MSESINYMSLAKEAIKARSNDQETDSIFYDCSLDSFLSEESSRKKIANLEDLYNFIRIGSSDKLINKSTKELWTLKKSDDGEYEIERLFDNDGDPLKL